MEKIKPLETKITRIGGSMGIIIPAYYEHAFDVKKGDKVKVKIEKLKDVSKSLI